MRTMITNPQSTFCAAVKMSKIVDMLIARKNNLTESICNTDQKLLIRFFKQNKKCTFVVKIVINEQINVQMYHLFGFWKE